MGLATDSKMSIKFYLLTYLLYKISIQGVKIGFTKDIPYLTRKMLPFDDVIMLHFMAKMFCEYCIVWQSQSTQFVIFLKLITVILTDLYSLI